MEVLIEQHGWASYGSMEILQMATMSNNIIISAWRPRVRRTLRIVVHFFDLHARVETPGMMFFTGAVDDRTGFPSPYA